MGAQVIEKMLIVHQGAIGDFICCLPALRCFRRALPSVHITLLGYPTVLEIALKRYYANAVLSVDRADMAFLYQEKRELSTALRRLFEGFQRIGVFGHKESPLIRNLVKLMGSAVVAIPPFPPPGRRIHMVEHALSLPRAMGFSVRREPPRLHLLAKDRHEATAFLRGHGVTTDGLVITIHPGSGSRGKMWPLDRFLALADALTAAHEAQILFVLGPGEEGIKGLFLKMIRRKAPVVLDSLPLPLLGAILERSHVFVGNDSGISHMAAAVDVPVVALFGPTDTAVWVPLGRKVTLIQRSLPCSPCNRKTMARCDHRDCLLGISVNEVFWAVSRVIKRRDKRPFGDRAQCPIPNREPGPVALSFP